LIESLNKKTPRVELEHVSQIKDLQGKYAELQKDMNVLGVKYKEIVKM
jgi:hypothetical protein